MMDCGLAPRVVRVKISEAPLWFRVLSYARSAYLRLTVSGLLFAKAKRKSVILGERNAQHHASSAEVIGFVRLAS